MQGAAARCPWLCVLWSLSAGPAAACRRWRVLLPDGSGVAGAAAGRCCCRPQITFATGVIHVDSRLKAIERELAKHISQHAKPFSCHVILL